MKNNNFLICLVGLPASGKSTFANSLKIALKEKFDQFEVIIVDPDIIRQKLTSNKFDYEKEQIVRNKNLEMIRSKLEQGNIVISDDLNYYSSMRHDLKEITDDLNLELFIIHISTPFEVCMKWNEERGEPIPNEVIRKIEGKFDIFNRYNWDNPIAKYDLSEENDLNKIIKDFLTKLKDALNLRNHKPGKERSMIISNLYNENLDKITRIYVGKIVQNPDFLPFKKKIFKLRKAYIKRIKNKALSNAEILKNFKIYLEETLDIKSS